MTIELNQMKENAQIYGVENELYKTNSKTGTNQYFRLSFTLGETKIILKKYKQVFQLLTNAYETGIYNIDFNAPVIVSSCKHFLN